MCGWLPVEERCGRAIPVAGCDVKPTVCPGYAQNLALVLEAYTAWAWFEKGQLALRFPQQTTILMECVELAAAAIAKANLFEHEELTRKAKRGAN